MSGNMVSCVMVSGVKLLNINVSYIKVKNCVKEYLLIKTVPGAEV